jgi:carboxyl-terminal processing protease
MRSTRGLWAGLAGALIALAIGLWWGGHPESLPGFLRDIFVQNDRALQAEVVSTIEDNYYKKIPKSQLNEASLRGMVASLHDAFSHYVSPKEAKRFQESIAGEFEGVGMTVEKDRRGLKVLTVFPGTPARKAGIRTGDLITAVNGRSIAGLDSEVATARIKGKAGTTVGLRVVTPGTKRARNLRVERKRIELPVAQGRTVTRDGRKLAVIRLLGFTSGSHGLLRQQVQNALNHGAKGIVLDLRGNGGGLLREAVLVCSIFIEDGTIVSVRGRKRANRTETASGDAIATHIPLVVLVDRGSASASEITTGALRDRHRATIVGTRTFGKGLVQEVEPLSNGGALDITVANYYLPDGETIPLHHGLRPAVPARDNPRTHHDEALSVALDTLLHKRR